MSLDHQDNVFNTIMTYLAFEIYLNARLLTQYLEETTDLSIVSSPLFSDDINRSKRF